MLFRNNKKITNNDDCKDYNSDLFKLCDKIAEDLLNFYRQKKYTKLFVFTHRDRSNKEFSPLCEIYFSTNISDFPYPTIMAYDYSISPIELQRNILEYISKKTNGCYVSDYVSSLDLNEYAKNDLIQFNVSKFEQNEDIIKWCKQIFANGNPQRISICTFSINSGSECIWFEREGYPLLDYVQLRALVDVIIEYSNNYYEIFSSESEGDYELRHIEKVNPKKW